MHIRIRPKVVAAEPQQEDQLQTIRAHKEAKRLEVDAMRAAKKKDISSEFINSKKK